MTEGHGEDHSSAGNLQRGGNDLNAGNGEAVMQDVKSEAACRLETDLHDTASEVGDGCAGNGEAVLQDVKSEAACRLETELHDTASGTDEGWVSDSENSVLETASAGLGGTVSETFKLESKDTKARGCAVSPGLVVSGKIDEIAGVEALWRWNGSST